MSSDTLKRLDELRRNLDNKKKPKTDYHIQTNTDYHIHRKVTIDDHRTPKPKVKKSPPKDIVTERIRTQVKQLFQYGFAVQGRTKLSVSADMKHKYERFRFKDEFQLASVLTEYAKDADLVVFMVNVDDNSIIWNSYGSKEVRLYKQ